MIPYYLHAKAAVLTSLYEGFPNVLVESITLGTPVVAFDSPGGTSEIVKDGVNGYLVEYQDVEDLKAKLIQVVSQKFNFEEVCNTVKKTQGFEVMKQYANCINALS